MGETSFLIILVTMSGMVNIFEREINDINRLAEHFKDHVSEPPIQNNKIIIKYDIIDGKPIPIYKRNEN